MNQGKVTPGVGCPPDPLGGKGLYETPFFSPILSAQIGGGLLSFVSDAFASPRHGKRQKPSTSEGSVAIGRHQPDENFVFAGRAVMAAVTKFPRVIKRSRCFSAPRRSRQADWKTSFASQGQACERPNFWSSLASRPPGHRLNRQMSQWPFSSSAICAPKIVLSIRYARCVCAEREACGFQGSKKITASQASAPFFVAPKTDVDAGFQLISAGVALRERGHWRNGRIHVDIRRIMRECGEFGQLHASVNRPAFSDLRKRQGGRLDLLFESRGKSQARFEIRWRDLPARPAMR